MRFFFKIILFTIFISSCGKDGELMETAPDESTGCSTNGLLENFIDSNGNDLYIYDTGAVFSNNGNSCDFELQYFDPDFESQNYEIDASGVFLKDNADLIAVKNNFNEDFEKADINDLFQSDITNPDFFWTNFTLQSPQAKTVAEYVTLSKCILEESCDFLDNRISIVEDPNDETNKVIKFSSVAPTADMVTSKCSLTSVLNYFKKEAEVWYEADYYIESGMPYSLVDFETSYFEGSPGPRLVIDNNKLEFENKFGSKLRFSENSATEVPLRQWFTVKVHLKFSNTGTGSIELWQDGVQILDTSGINLPTSNAIQNILEVGISATQEDTVLLMDNLRISDTAF